MRGGRCGESAEEDVEEGAEDGVEGDVEGVVGNARRGQEKASDSERY